MKKFYLVLLLLFSSQFVWADFNDGVVAYLMGDYEKAYNTMMSLTDASENGLPHYYLGVMYMKGQGVEQDFEEASKWLREAAERRLPQAQYKLANLYKEGKGVPQDFEFAYIWYKVGAAHQHALSLNAVDAAKNNLSENELAEAEKLLVKYIKDYGPGPEQSNNTNVQLEDPG